MIIAEVIVDIAHSQVDKVFDYIATPDVQKGQRVVVPFGKQTLEGYVINLKSQSSFEKDKLKSIIKTLEPYPLITEEFFALSDFMIKHYNLKRVDTLRLFFPSAMRGQKVKEQMQTVLLVNEFSKEFLTQQLKKSAKNQFALLDYIKPNEVYIKSELNKRFGQGAVEKFITLKVFTEKQVHKDRDVLIKDRENEQITLNSAQKEILDKLNTPKTHLIFGVTGSGKTEIYMHKIMQCLKEGKTAIMLVPEIGLTPQVLSLFKARFGNNIATLHSGLSAGEKFDQWQKIRKQEVQIVVGARSAIFAPLKNLGVIIIDEEHDSSYQSDSNPRYSTHTIAKFRAKYNNCPLVLGSATPSIESFYKAQQGEYELYELKTRVNNQEMPKVQIVDMRNELSFGNTGIFSRQLQADLKDCIDSKNQAMLFCNRRGFASYIICRECGYVAKCEDCDASLVYHKEENLLKCHFCGKKYKALKNCPKCNSKYIRMGAIGTEKVVSELKEMFPEVKVLRMDFDTTQTKFAHANILDEFAQTKPSILVGTQMIAKGHHFPNVTLVGIVDADMSLHFSDFRNTERTFQLLTQVSGRAGRASKAGKIVLQTYAPKHYVYRFMANYNYKAFFERELELRKNSKFPPFAYIVRILITGFDEQKVIQITSKINKDIEKLKNDQFIFLKAMKAPVGKIQTKHRYQILMRILPTNFEKVLNQIYEVVNKNRNNDLNVFVEVNPNNLS